MEISFNLKLERNKEMDSWDLVTIEMRNDEDLAYLDDMMHEGWEPFAVTQNKRVLTYHLKRVVVCGCYLKEGKIGRVEV